MGGGWDGGGCAFEFLKRGERCIYVCMYAGVFGHVIYLL